jgi:hypothetical protein
VSGDKHYPVWQFVLEATAIAVFLVYIFMYGYSLVVSHEAAAKTYNYLWLKLTVAGVAAYLTADFLSGIAHFLADNFGNPNTPVFGKVFIFAFREHHVDPKAITRHSYVETNGANSLISLPGLIYFYHDSSPTEDYTFRFFITMFYLSIFMTNQIHKWAHLDTPGRWINFLQKSHLILPAAHHDVHHHAPYDKYYCITCGWLNAPLDAIRFFPTLKRVLTLHRSRAKSE